MINTHIYLLQMFKGKYQFRMRAIIYNWICELCSFIGFHLYFFYYKHCSILCFYVGRSFKLVSHNCEGWSAIKWYVSPFNQIHIGFDMSSNAGRLNMGITANHHLLGTQTKGKWQLSYIFQKLTYFMTPYTVNPWYSL